MTHPFAVSMVKQPSHTIDLLVIAPCPLYLLSSRHPSVCPLLCGGRIPVPLEEITNHNELSAMPLESWKGDSSSDTPCLRLPKTCPILLLSTVRELVRHCNIYYLSL